MGKNNEYQLQIAKEVDYLKLIEVWEAAVRASHDFLTGNDIVFFRSKILDEYFISVNIHYLSDEMNEIMGFIGTTENKIEMLFVAPQMQGKGVGKALLQYAISSLGVTEVDVNKQNLKAIDFYLQQGFRCIGSSEVDNSGKPFPLLHLRHR